jgi:hypothetical protein
MVDCCWLFNVQGFIPPEPVDEEGADGVVDCDELQKADTQASRDASCALNAEPESLEADKGFAKPTSLAFVSYFFLRNIRNEVNILHRKQIDTSFRQEHAGSGSMKEIHLVAGGFECESTHYGIVTVSHSPPIP